MRLEFFMPMVPPTVTHQAKRLAITKAGRPVMFDSAELKAVRAKLRDNLGPHVGDAKFEGALRLMSKWCWPCEGTAHVNGEYHTDKPDTDNVAKTLKDAMEDVGAFAVGDQQVASDITEKFWADVPGIYVRLEELT